MEKKQFDSEIIFGDETKHTRGVMVLFKKLFKKCFVQDVMKGKEVGG